jgi:hypothetical protein
MPNDIEAFAARGAVARTQQQVELVERSVISAI